MTYFGSFAKKKFFSRVNITSWHNSSCCSLPAAVREKSTYPCVLLSNAALLLLLLLLLWLWLVSVCLTALAVRPLEWSGVSSGVWCTGYGGYTVPRHGSSSGRGGKQDGLSSGSLSPFALTSQDSGNGCSRTSRATDDQPAAAAAAAGAVSAAAANQSPPPPPSSPSIERV
jgi:hypothetical protein